METLILAISIDFDESESVNIRVTGGQCVLLNQISTLFDSNSVEDPCCAYAREVGARKRLFPGLPYVNTRAQRDLNLLSSH